MVDPFLSSLFSPFICYYWGIPPKLSVGGLGQRVLRRHSLVLLMSVFSLAGAFLIVLEVFGTSSLIGSLSKAGEA